jgi:hypothetical protein
VNLLSQFFEQVQDHLFPKLEEAFGELGANERRLVQTLELVRIEEHVPRPVGRWPGRPEADRRALARAFVAKAVYNFPTTRALLDAVVSRPKLRRICGWEHRGEVPSEASFSRAFAELAASDWPQRVHAALLAKHEQPRLVGHLSRDATAVVGRERVVCKPEPEAKALRPTPKRGRPRRGEPRPPKPLTRLQWQARTLDLDAMLADLPSVCDRGCKRSSAGHVEYWKGYKLHVDWADGEIPISCVVTSASVHDSQVALPLGMMSAQRVTNLYDLMDAAYDAKEIREHSRALGHVPIIDANSRRYGLRVGMDLATARRYRERTTAERGFARLKDEFGGRTVRVRGAMKVMAHLMFGVLALTADQLLRLAG